MRETGTYSVLKIKDWLKFSDPDEEGFLYHLEMLKTENMRISRRLIINLAKSYKINVPFEPGVLYEEIIRILSI